MVEKTEQETVELDISQDVLSRAKGNLAKGETIESLIENLLKQENERVALSVK